MADIKETINRLEDVKAHFKSMQDIDDCADYTEYVEAIETAVEVMKKAQ